MQTKITQQVLNGEQDGIQCCISFCYIHCPFIKEKTFVDFNFINRDNLYKIKGTDDQ